MLALFVAAAAFAPNTPVLSASPTACARSTVPCATLSSRRSAIAGAASFAAAAAAMPMVASAETSEEAIARIAQKNYAALEAERDAKKAKIAKNMNKVEKENAGSTAIVGIIGLASFVFSLPFFYKNLARLFLRYRSVVDSSIDASQYDKNYRPPSPGSKRTSTKVKGGAAPPAKKGFFGR